MKCQVDEMSSWWNVMLMKCQVVEMSGLWNVELTKCQVDKMSSWQNDPAPWQRAIKSPQRKSWKNLKKKIFE